MLKGGIKNPPLHSLVPIPEGFWEHVRIDAYWALAGSAQNVAGHRAESVVRNGDHEGMHDVRLNQRQLKTLWLPRPSPFIAPRIPLASLRDLAMEYGLNLDHRDPAASNLAYHIQGELKEAAANNRLTVWGRPYYGPVRDNDPLIAIPAGHFKEYSLGHWCSKPRYGKQPNLHHNNGFGGARKARVRGGDVLRSACFDDCRPRDTQAHSQ